MTPAQVIEYYGTEQAAANALGLTRQAVNYWVQQSKIPLMSQAWIQVQTKGKLKVAPDAAKASGKARRNGS